MNKFEQLRIRSYYAVPTDYFKCATHVPRVFSDIQVHLPIIESFAKLCSSAAEFGVRDGHSTVALLRGLSKGQWRRDAKLISYDIESTPFVEEMMRNMGDWPCQWQFRLKSSIEPPAIEEVDLLFVDTLHTYVHVGQELALHGRQAKKYIIYHDHVTCGEFDLSGENPKAIGIAPAIKDFQEKYPGEYKNVYESNDCNGLLVLERIL